MSLSTVSYLVLILVWQAQSFFKI